MKTSARARLIRIGNSRGIRIPKDVIDRLNLTDDIEIIFKDDHLEVHPGRKPREGWGDAFREMAERGDDRLLDEHTPTKWDNEEWTW